jgi:branched-chain amino acid transport system permease protein
MIGLGAIGITLTYSILRFANFAHGEFISWGAYIAFAASGALAFLAGVPARPIEPFSFGWTLPVALVLAVALTAGLALLIDALLFGPLRRRGSAVIILVMASFGAALALRSLLEFIFTSRPQYYSRELQIARRLGGGIRATPDQLLTIAVAALLVVAVHLLLTHTGVGRSMRAVSENQQLAGLAGIDVRKVIRTVWMLGAGLACVAGVMSGLLVCRSGRRWGLTCCCRSSPLRSSAALARRQAGSDVVSTLNQIPATPPSERKLSDGASFVRLHRCPSAGETFNPPAALNAPPENRHTHVVLWFGLSLLAPLTGWIEQGERRLRGAG